MPMNLTSITKDNRFFFLFFLLILISCKKDSSNSIKLNTTMPITLAEAKTYFNNEVLPNSPLTIEADRKRINIITMLDLSKENDLLYKKPVWEKAYAKNVQNGTAIAIPIHFDVKSFLQTGDGVGINFDKLNYLLIKKATNGDMSAEWITLYPDQDWISGNRGKYTGRLLVADWDGHLKYGYSYDKAGKTLKYEGRNRQIERTQSIMLSRSKNVSELRLPNNGSIKILSYSSIRGKELSGMKYKDKDGNCWENIREAPAESGVGVVLYRKSVACVDPSTPDAPPVTTYEPVPKSGGGGSGGGGSDYTPPNCNPDPNYVVPNHQPPAGTSWILPCGGDMPVIEPIILQEVTITIDQNNAILCGYYNNMLTADGYSGQVNNLGFTMSRNVTGEPSNSFVVLIGAGCFEIPAYNANSYGASEIFKAAYNYAVSDVMEGVKYGIIPANSASVGLALNVAIKANLLLYHPGSSFSPGPCLGGIPQTNATFNCK